MKGYKVTQDNKQTVMYYYLQTHAILIFQGYTSNEVFLASQGECHILLVF